MAAGDLELQLLAFLLGTWPFIAAAAAVLAAVVAVRVHHLRWLVLINGCLDGTLNAADWARLTNHLVRCSSCRSAFKAYRAIELLGQRFRESRK